MKKNYLISHKRKKAFALIPKTGITTILTIIISEDFTEVFEKFPKEYIETVKLWNFLKKNIPTNDYLSEIIPKNYKTYAFVRNPYDRIYASFFHYNLYKKKKKRLHPYYNYKDFLKYKLKELIVKDWHFMPQKYFIQKLSGNYKIFKFEEFEDSIKKIFKGTDIPHANKKNKNKFDYDEESIKIINKYYSWDFKHLGYKKIT